MATWTTFLAQLRRELEEESPGVWADESLMEWTNDAISEIADRTLVLVDDQDTSTVAGQQSYALPANTIAPTIVFYEGKKLLRENLSDWWQASDIDAQGTPRFYANTRDAIYLRPIPDSAGELRYFRTYRPTPFTSIEDATDMPFDGRYNAAVRAYVRARALEQVGDVNEASMYQTRYDNAVEQAVYEARKERGADTFLPSEAW